jgi:hypothetical protein
MLRTDEDLAGLVAQDIERHLAAARVEGPVYGIALWIDEGYTSWDETAQYGLSVGTEADTDRMRGAPFYRDIPDERWYGWPTSPHWNSGDWSHLVEDFLRPDTETALEPLREQIRGEVPALEEAAGRWHEIAVKALTLAALPPELPTTADVLVYPEGPDLTCAEKALAMLGTVPPERLHESFPVWRRTAEAVRSASADDAMMADLRARTEGERFPRWHEAPPDEFTGLLMACGLDWLDVTTSSDNLRTALRVADSGSAG